MVFIIEWVDMLFRYSIKFYVLFLLLGLSLPNSIAPATKSFGLSLVTGDDEENDDATYFRTFKNEHKFRPDQYIEYHVSGLFWTLKHAERLQRILIF